MTAEALKEGARLQSLIDDYRRTLEYFEGIKDEAIKERLAEFLTGARNIPNKEQIAFVMLEAAKETCKVYINQAQEAFDAL